MEHNLVVTQDVAKRIYGALEIDNTYGMLDNTATLEWLNQAENACPNINALAKYLTTWINQTEDEQTDDCTDWLDCVFWNEDSDNVVTGTDLASEIAARIENELDL